MRYFHERAQEPSAWNRGLKQLEPVETWRRTWVTLMAVRGGLLAAHLRRLVIGDMRGIESVHEMKKVGEVLLLSLSLGCCKRDVTDEYLDYTR